MTTQRRIRPLVAVSVCLVTLATVGLLAQVTVNFGPGPWKMSEGGIGDPLPGSGPIVHVPFDRIQRRYLTIEPGQLDLWMTVKADCDGKGEQYVGLELEVAGAPAALRLSGLGKLKGGGFSGTTSAATKVPIATMVKGFDIPDPVEMCNKDLETMLAGNQHGKAQQGWARRFDSVVPAGLKLSCTEKNKKKPGGFEEPGALHERTDTTRFPLWVHCRPAAVFKTTSGGGKPPVKAVGVQSAQVWINPKSNADYRGVCPKRLTFGGSIEFLGGAGTTSDIRYRYRAHDNAMSPVYTVTFQGSGTKNLHSWQRDFGATSPAGTLAAPGAGGGIKKVDGWVRLEVLDGNAVDKTDRADFTLTCEPQRTNADLPVAQPRRTAVLVLPDLLIDTVEEQDARTLRIRVGNQGTAAAAATSVQLFYHRSGHVVQKSFPVPALGAKQSAWVVADAGSPLAAANRILLRVDDPSAVAELNEGNNGYTVK